jgi:hypothetical protein
MCRLGNVGLDCELPTGQSAFIGAAIDDDFFGYETAIRQVPQSREGVVRVGLGQVPDE